MRVATAAGGLVRLQVDVPDPQVLVDSRECRATGPPPVGIYVVLEIRTVAGPSSVVQWVLSGGPYTTASHVRQCQLVWLRRSVLSR